MPVYVKVKVKNDQKSLTEEFEADEVTLSLDSAQMQSWCKKVIADFGEPVETCQVKARIDV